MSGLLEGLLLLPGWARSSIALLLLMVTFVVGTSVIAALYEHYTALAVDIDAARKQLGVLQRLQSYRVPVNDSSRDVEQGLFFDAASDAIVAAELQSWFSGVAQRHRLDVKSVMPATVEEAQHVRWIGLKVDFSGPFGSIVDAVREIEVAQRPLMIRSLSVNSAATMASPTSEFLSARLHFYGAVRKGQSR